MRSQPPSSRWLDVTSGAALMAVLIADLLIFIWILVFGGEL